MNFSIQPTITNDIISISPLENSDFEELYLVASDSKIWEQHPNKDRWKKEVFTVFFTGAMESKGAFKIVDTKTNKIIGSTRFYDYNPTDKSILIGYTFYATAYWGKGINKLVKTEMLNYIFQFVDKVYFNIGADNVRSQIAIARLGAEKVDEQEVTYFGETSKLNFVYLIEKDKY